MKKIALAIIALATLASCNNGKIKIKNDSLSMYHLEEEQIIAESKMPISYTSENEFNASVDDEGLVTAHCIGETKIKLSTDDDVKYVDVKVKPKHNLYIIPDISFGENRESVISKLGEPDSENSNGVISYNNYCLVGITMMISFENGKMDSFAFVIPSSYYSRLTDFLAERYMTVGTSNGVIYLVDAISPSSATYYIGVSYYSGNYVVLYMDPTTKDRNTSKIIELL